MTINDDTYSEQMQDSIEPIIHSNIKEEETIIIGADHRGYELKEHLKSILLQKKFEVMDVGTHNSDSCDYPSIAHSLCNPEIRKPERLGVLICGSGYGMCIASNRHLHIHAAACRTVEEVKAAREHGNINVLCLGADFTDQTRGENMLEAFLNTSFSGIERHAHRIEMMDHFNDDEERRAREQAANKTFENEFDQSSEREGGWGVGNGK